MNKRKNLGQHFLKSKTIAESIVSSAEITRNDVVLEIGTGYGILIPYLCKNAKQVFSIENDQGLYLSTKSNFHDYLNLVLEYGDGFNSDHNFSIFISNLPYSKSRFAIEWLLRKKFSRAVIMVQKEFAEKLTSKEEHKAISVLANYGFKIKFLMDVKKSNIIPIPKVDSTVVLLEKKKVISKVLIFTVNKIFSYRRKTLQNILKQFGLNSTSKKRLDELSGDEIIKIAQKIVKS
jgi:16S rRNA (adenine1518-N6/adenine1519-N6)-dimethyltransferase